MEGLLCHVDAQHVIAPARGFAEPVIQVVLANPQVAGFETCAVRRTDGAAQLGVAVKVGACLLEFPFVGIHGRLRRLKPPR
jgi:hypothetical protein